MKHNRRSFLRTALSLSTAAMVPTISSTKVFASDSDQFNDYKALVYVYLHGGNDSFNMVIPTQKSGQNGYDNYQSVRSEIAIDHTDLSANINLAASKLDLSSGNPYSAESEDQAYTKGMYHVADTEIGINGVMPEIAHLMGKNKLAVLANIGTLVEPTTKSDMQNQSIELPSSLFAHNIQTRVQQTGQADNKHLGGWIGRLFDQWSGVNGNNLIGSNISFHGNNYALLGRTNAPTVMSLTPTEYNFGKTKQFTASNTTSNEKLRRDLNQLNSGNKLRNVYNGLLSRSYDLADTINTVWQTTPNYTSTDAYNNELFSVPTKQDLGIDIDGGLIKQLEAVARMIKYGKDTGLKRQVFYVQLSGFDTHSSQKTAHPALLRELSLGLGKFQAAMEEMGTENDVTTFTLSDFGRTATCNGDGTDHAWAGHNFVVGGAVNGGVYGEMPDLTPNGSQESGYVGGRNTGRIIPSIAVDQQLSTLTKWFGANDELINDLFPNLTNFSSTQYGRDIGFMS